MSIEAEKGMCRHDARAVCWMCSDQQAWWRDARIKAGYSAEPPNAMWVRLKNWEDEVTARRPVDLTCGACDRPYYALGLCHRHYDRSRKIGTQVRALRAYTGASDYSKIEVQTEYKKRVGAALTARPLAQTG